VEDFSSKYGSLYLGLDRYKKHSIYFNVLFLLRRFVLVLILTFVQNTPSLQLILLQLASLATIIYIIKVQPMEDQSLNTFELVSESCVLLCILILPSFTDYNAD
jgi:hypothetical protein